MHIPFIVYGYMAIITLGVGSLRCLSPEEAMREPETGISMFCIPCLFLFPKAK